MGRGFVFKHRRFPSSSIKASIALTVLLGIGVASSDAAVASPSLPLQTLNMVAGNTDAQHPIGSADPFTDVSIDGGLTWQPAILAGPHPYDESPGTNSWLNCQSITQSPPRLMPRRCDRSESCSSAVPISLLASVRLLRGESCW